MSIAVQGLSLKRKQHNISGQNQFREAKPMSSQRRIYYVVISNWTHSQSEFSLRRVRKKEDWYCHRPFPSTQLYRSIISIKSQLTVYFNNMASRIIILLLVISMKIVPSSAGQGGCFKHKDDFIPPDEREYDFGNAPPKWAGVATEGRNTVYVGAALVNIPGYGLTGSNIIIGTKGTLRRGMCVHFGIGYRDRQTLGSSVAQATIEDVQHLNCRIGGQNIQKVSIAKLNRYITFGAYVQGAILPWDIDENFNVNNGFTGTTIGKAQRERTYHGIFYTFHEEEVQVVGKSNCAHDQGRDFLETHSICVARIGGSSSSSSTGMWQLNGFPLVAPVPVGSVAVPALYAMQYARSSGRADGGDWFLPFSSCTDQDRQDIRTAIHELSTSNIGG